MTASLLPLFYLGLAILVQTAVVAFFGGELTQRIASAEKLIGDESVKSKEPDDKIDTKIGDQSAILVQMVEMRTEQAHTNKTLDKVCHKMIGRIRQLANIAMNWVGIAGEQPAAIVKPPYLGWLGPYGPNHP